MTVFPRLVCAMGGQGWCSLVYWDTIPSQYSIMFVHSQFVLVDIYSIQYLFLIWSDNFWFSNFYSSSFVFPEYFYVQHHSLSLSLTTLSPLSACVKLVYSTNFFPLQYYLFIYSFPLFLSSFISSSSFLCAEVVLCQRRPCGSPSLLRFLRCGTTEALRLLPIVACVSVIDLSRTQDWLEHDTGWSGTQCYSCTLLTPQHENKERQKRIEHYLMLIV